MKILLFRKGALGDILMTTPLIRQTRRNFPKSEIDYLVGNSYKTIAQNNKYLNKIIGFDEKIFENKNIIGLFRLIRQIRSNSYDLIFVLDKHWIYSLIAYLSGVPKRIGYIRDSLSKLFLTKGIDRRSVRHEILYYLDLLHQFSEVDYSDTKIDFFVGPDVDIKVKHLIKDFVVVVNSGGDNLHENSQIRKLPDKKFKELIDKLVKTNNIALIGGKNDAIYYEKFIGDKIINFAGKLSLEESAALMKNAKHIYTTDSGAMHVASAVNDNITAFFGPTNPVRKAPLVSNIQSIWQDSDIYEEEYELSGRIPKGKFFTKFRAELID